MFLTVPEIINYDHHTTVREREVSPSEILLLARCQQNDLQASDSSPVVDFEDIVDDIPLRPNSSRGDVTRKKKKRSMHFITLQMVINRYDTDSLRQCR